MSDVLQRTTFSTSRLLEFFTEKELQMQIGHSKQLWAIALLKELIDNALDACETVGMSPEITVEVEADALSVCDNGPGLPYSTLEASLDYAVRVSDKAYYVSPTRGQLGNALKCVWAAPFVVDGNYGQIDVATPEYAVTVAVELDRIAQQPRLTLSDSAAVVKNGTFVKMHWREIARLIAPFFYNNSDSMGGAELVRRYAAFNPHATFHYIEGDQKTTYPARLDTWAKWKTSDPTSPHWYSPERFTALIAAYVAHERETGHVRTVREFVSEFRGISGTQKQKAVTERAGLSGRTLRDLVVNGDIDRECAATLLAAMQAETRPVKSEALGIIGEEAMRLWLVDYSHVALESVQYKRVIAKADAVPFVLEVAFGIYTEEFEQSRGQNIVGLNWTPAVKTPLQRLPAVLNKAMIERDDPTVMLVHLSQPQMEFIDRGKGALG